MERGVVVRGVCWRAVYVGLKSAAKFPCVARSRSLFSFLIACTICAPRIPARWWATDTLACAHDAASYDSVVCRSVGIARATCAAPDNGDDVAVFCC